MPSSVPATLDFAIQQAESFARRGDWNGAFAEYRTILQNAVRVRDDGLPTLRAGHLVVMDRFADLAIPLGYTSAARELLSAMASLSGAAGDWYGRDYAAIKGMLLEIGSGALDRADRVLRSMASTLGDVDRIEFTDAGLIRWEAGRSWTSSDEADRAVLFSQLYLAMGSLLAALGSYGDALQALRRGLTFTGPSAPDLARRAAPVLRAAIAAALLERGDLDEARRVVDPLRAQSSEFAEPAQYVRLHEIAAKLCLLRGQFGLAPVIPHPSS